MRTGEGKTLVATLPVYLNAIAGKGVHVVSVNDYLARRDSAQMGKLYNFLDLTVDVVYPGMDHADKHAAYAADIRSEEHTSELQSLMRISYAVFCLKKNTNA